MESTATEPHPYPERPVWRIGAPVVATMLSVALALTMLALPAGSTQTTALVVLLVVAFGLMLARSLYTRRTARLADAPLHWHQFVFWWGSMAALWFLGTTRTTTWALVQLGSGLATALFLTWALSPVKLRRREKKPDRRLVPLRARPADPTGEDSR